MLLLAVVQVLSQFFIAILVSAWDAATLHKAELDAATAAPAGFVKRPLDRPLGKRVAGAVLYALTGYSMLSRCLVAQISFALGTCVRRLENQMNHRRDQAEAMYALESDKLTKAEENEHFLFTHGLVLVTKAQKSLRRVGLTEATIKSIMTMYVHIHQDSAHASQIVDDMKKFAQRASKTNLIGTGVLTPDAEQSTSLPLADDNMKALLEAVTAPILDKINRMDERLQEMQETLESQQQQINHALANDGQTVETPLVEARIFTKGGEGLQRTQGTTCQAHVA